MSIHRKLRAQENLQDRREAEAQLADIDADLRELTVSPLSKAELEELEAENERHKAIIHGYDPTEGFHYQTVAEYNLAIQSLVWLISDQEHMTISMVRVRISEEERFRKDWIADYFAELVAEDSSFTESI